MFALWPFGKTVVRRAGRRRRARDRQRHLVRPLRLVAGARPPRSAASLLCLTIIGIPLGLANFKLIPVSLLPLGREIVSVEQARAMGLTPVVASRGERMGNDPEGSKNVACAA